MLNMCCSCRLAERSHLAMYHRWTVSTLTWILLQLLLHDIRSEALPPMDPRESPVAFLRRGNNSTQLPVVSLLPNSSYDVVGQKGSGTVIVFAWDSSTKTATLCREYNPGPNQILCGLAAGIIEEDKHDSNVRTAAEHELEEELHLSGGTWYSLLDEPMAMDKYATTMIHPFLVIDAQHVSNPRPLDDEEEIEILTGIPVDEIIRIIRQGGMNVVASWAVLLALEKLRLLGEIN